MYKFSVRNLAIGSVIGIICALCGPSAIAQSANRECRTAALPDGSPALFCKDKKGNWKQQEGKVEIAPVAVTTAPAAPLLKAEGKYQGTYEFFFKEPPRNQRPRNLADILLGEINNPLNSQVVREPGGISMTLNFDGPLVTAEISGSTIVYKKLIGTVQNGSCVLNNPGGEGHGSVRYEGACGAQGFAGKISGITRRNVPYTGTFQTTVISFTDNSQKEAERTSLQAKCDGGSVSACVELEQKK